MADNSLSFVERIKSSIRVATEYFSPQPKDRLQDKSTSQFPDFFWDLITSYVATAIFGLAGLDIASSLLRSSIHCYIPGEPTIRQNDFVNGYCRQHVPPTYYLPLFLFFEGILLGGVHFAWKTIHYGKFYTFLRQATSMDRHRDSKTGEYSQNTSNIVRNLERTFRRSRMIICTYRFKIVLQLAIVAGGIGISTHVFKLEQFNTGFNCTFDRNSTLDTALWPDSPTIVCAIPVLRSHLAAWVINFVLLSVAVFSCIYGILWSISVHTAKLNYEEAALFTLLSGVHHVHAYQKYTTVKWLLGLVGLKFRIWNDFDFLFLRLTRLDAGHGTVMKDVLVSNRLQDKLKELNENLNLILSYNPQGAFSVNSLKKDVRKFILGQQESVDDAKVLVLKNVLQVIEDKLQNLKDTVKRLSMPLDFFQAHNQEDLIAFDISIGMPGFSMFIPLLKLERPFSRVVSFNFDPNYQNSQEPVLYQEFTGNRFTIRTQPDIFTSDLISIRLKLDTALKKCLIIEPPRNTTSEPHLETIGTSESTLEVYSRSTSLPLLSTFAEREPKKRKANLIVVGPFMDKDRKMTVHWFLSLMVYSEFIAEEAMLIVFCPLAIDGMSIKGTYVDYWPVVPWYKAKSTEEILDCGGTKVKFKISVHLYLKHPEYYDEIITGTVTPLNNTA